MTIKKLKLTDIRLDGNTQPRSRVYDETVSKYHEDLADGAHFPPVEVFFDGKHYWLADGFHRYHAHRRAGYKDIESQVHSGTKRDAFIFSRGANSEHGLPRTNEEKRSVVLSLLEDPEFEGEYDREIARICKVSNTLVSRLKKELELKKGGNKKMPPPPPAKPSLKPVVNEVSLDEEDRVKELATELKIMAEENAALKDKLAVSTMDDSDEAKAEVSQTLEELREEVKRLEFELASVTKSRNEFQNQAAEAIKQVAYWKRRAEKAERQAA